MRGSTVCMYNVEEWVAPFNDRFINTVARSMAKSD